MKNGRGVILGEVVYIAIIYRYHIQGSWIYLLKGYDFSFDHMTGEHGENKLIKLKIVYKSIQSITFKVEVEINQSQPWFQSPTIYASLVCFVVVSELDSARSYYHY